MRLAASCISPSLEGWATGEQLGDWLHFARGADVADSLRCAGVLLAGLVAEHARADLGAEEDGGQAAAGVGAAADEEEVVEAGEFVLGAEVEHLAQVVGEVEGGAFVDVEALPGVGGVDDFLLDPAAEVDAHLVADLVEGTFAVGRHGLLPVDFAVAVGRGDEQVDAALAFGGEGGVDATGVADVDAGVLADGAVGGDIGEILLVFAADVDGVVREIDIAVNAQVEHGGGAGVFFGVEGLGLILRSCAVADARGDEILESPGCIGVDEDVVVREGRVGEGTFVCDADAGCVVVATEGDFGHGGIGDDLDVEFVGEFGEGLHESVAAADWVPDAVFVLDERQDGEEAGAVKGGHAQVLGLKTHGEFDVRISEVAAELIVDALPRL